jgi:hypothetical protein
MNVDYPTDEQLEKIKTWDYKDLRGLMDYIQGLWEFAERGWIQEGNIYTLITSGWSGNESIVGALSDNTMVWALYWQSSTRGGRHVFMPLTSENMDKLDGRG